LRKELSDDEEKSVRITSLIQTRRVDSWHEGWGFPRPTLIAMAAGSCVRLKVTNADLDLNALKRIEAEGIGERRGEGYGQIGFNPPLLTQKINQWSPAEKLNKETMGSESPKHALLPDEFTRQIEETVWREETKVAVLKTASSEKLRNDIFGFEIEGKGNNKRSVPPMSQIGGLRSVISRVQKFSDADIVKSWVEHLKDTENRRKKWAEDKKTAEEKLNRISRLVQDKEYVWRVLAEEVVDGRRAWKQPSTLTQRDLQKDEKLWAEAVRSLFDACARAHKRDLEKPEKGEKEDGAKD
jgi:CRISPR-associated protein Csx10